jgi:hypothetical protein
MDKGRLLLRADQYTKFAAGCGRNNATHFIALAQYYRTWAHEAEKQSQEAELLRPSTIQEFQEDSVGTYERPIFRLTDLTLYWLQYLSKCATIAILFSSQVPFQTRHNPKSMLAKGRLN